MSNLKWSNKPNWQCWWPSEKTGRYVKRQLAKARRQQIKEELATGRIRSVSGKEREANWKTW